MFEFITHRSFAPEHADAAIALTQALCIECAKQPGYISMQVYRPHDRRNEIYLVEHWEDEASVHQWVATDIFQTFKAAVADYAPTSQFMPSERIFG